MSEPRTMQPHDLDAEASVLGAMIASPQALEIAADMLGDDGGHFYRAANRTAYRAMMKMRGRGDEVDPVTLSAELGRLGELEKVGGKAALHTFVAIVPAVANVAHYAEIVREASLRRQLMRAGYEIVERAANSPEAAPELLDAAERQIYALADGGRPDGPVAIEDSLRALVESLPERRAGGHVKHVLCGFAHIDDPTGGLGRGELCILGARPSVGKTTLATCIALHVALEEGPVVFFSLEMGQDAVTDRIVQAHAGVSGAQLRHGRLEDAQLARIDDLRERARGRLHIDATPAVTPLHVRHEARKENAKAPLALVVVDYLQLMRAASRAENRQQEVAEISHSLKALALELDCPVLALSQLNRQLEGRSEDARPRLSDLRDSGAIEQDADVVVFLHTASDQRKAALNGATTIDVEVEVAKNRNGAIGSGTLRFDRPHTQFRDKLPR
jgi:replicative DNA helicase